MNYALLLLGALLCAQTSLAYNVRTEIAFSQYSRVRDSAAVSTSVIYIAAYSMDNSSVFEYNLDTKTSVPLVQNSGGSGCIPSVNDPSFSERFPIIPTSLHYNAKRNALMIADRTPSNRVFMVSRNDSIPLVRHMSSNTYQVTAGGACAYAERTFPENDEGVPSNTSMTMPQSMVYDELTGNVYISLRNSVAVVSPNGTMKYFFGSDNRRGTRDDSWNDNVTDRRNATTKNPAQLSLDKVNRILYVAEQGFSTVRAISLIDDSARIILGKLAGTTAWPPARCYPAACTAGEVDLYYVSALAIYHPRTVNERWLFVGDRTLAQVFKYVLDTKMVYAVGGTSLQSGYTDGPIGQSSFRAITYFSTADSLLFISDGALRVMDLEDRVTPAPPVISEPVVTSTTTTVMVTTVVALNPMGIVQVSRANVILDLLRCQREFGYLDPINHLLRFTIGDDPDFQYYAGAVVGNTSLALGFVLLHAFIAWVFATAWETSFGAATASLRFPSLVAFPLMFVMESTMASSVSLSLYAAGYYQAIGIVGIVACVAVTAGIAVYFTFVFEGARADDFELSKRHSGLLVRFIRPVGEWITTDNNRRMGMFFNDYLPDRWWFAMVELVMCISTGIAEGIKPVVFGQCLALIIYATVMYTVFFSLLLFLQPNNVRFKFVTGVVIAGLQGIACYMLIATIVTKDRNWEAVSTSLVLASLYVGLPRSLLELVELFLDIYRLMKEHQTHRQNVQVGTTLPILVRSDSNSGSENSSILMDDVVLQDADWEKRQERSFAGSFNLPLSERRSGNNSMVGGTLQHEKLRAELRSYMVRGEVETEGKLRPHSPVSATPSSPPPPPPPAQVRTPTVSPDSDSDSEFSAGDL